MPQADMHFTVEVSNFNSLTDPVKSLINFFLKDSAVFLEGNYDSSDVWQGMFGNIQTVNRTITTDSRYSDEYYHVSLNIAYAGTSPDPYPAEVSYTDDESGLPMISSTLVEKTSMLQICQYASVSVGGGEYVYKATAFASGVAPLNIPVTITPKIGTTVNTDSSYVPSGITTSNKVLPVKFSTSNGTFDSDYQLRTSSFRVCCGSEHTPTHYDVFYKIGICPLANKIRLDNWTNSVSGRSLSDLITVLKTTQDGSSWTGGRKLGIYVESVSDPAFIQINFSSYNAEYEQIRSEKDFVQEAGIGSHTFDVLPQRMILPLVLETSSTQYIEAYVYIQLFNNDGTVFNVDPDDFECKWIQVSEDGVTYVDAGETQTAPYYMNNKAYLIITDQDMSGGFIGTPNIPNNDY